MAGSDAGIAVILMAEDMKGAVEEIASHQGAHITLQLSPNLLVAHFPPAFHTGSLTKSRTIEGDDPQTLDHESQLLLRAWKAGQLKRDTATSPSEGLKWDAPGYQAPGKLDPEPSEGLKWDTPGYQAPGKLDPEPSEGLKWDTPRYEAPGKLDPESSEGLKWDTPGYQAPGKLDPESSEGLKWDTPGYQAPGKIDPESPGDTYIGGEMEMVPGGEDCSQTPLSPHMAAPLPCSQPPPSLYVAASSSSCSLPPPSPLMAAPTSSYTPPLAVHPANMAAPAISTHSATPLFSFGAAPPYVAPLLPPPSSQLGAAPFSQALLSSLAAPSPTIPSQYPQLFTTPAVAGDGILQRPVLGGDMCGRPGTSTDFGHSTSPVPAEKGCDIRCSKD